MKLKEALQIGDAGQVVGWNQKEAEWILYKTTEEAPKGITPDFIIIQKGKLPLPLNDTAVEALYTLIQSEVKS